LNESEKRERKLARKLTKFETKIREVESAEDEKRKRRAQNLIFEG